MDEGKLRANSDPILVNQSKLMPSLGGIIGLLQLDQLRESIEYMRRRSANDSLKPLARDKTSSMKFFFQDVNLEKSLEDIKSFYEEQKKQWQEQALIVPVENIESDIPPELPPDEDEPPELPPDDSPRSQEATTEQSPREDIKLVDLETSLADVISYYREQVSQIETHKFKKVTVDHIAIAERTSPNDSPIVSPKERHTMLSRQRMQVQPVQKKEQRKSQLWAQIKRLSVVEQPKPETEDDEEDEEETRQRSSTLMKFESQIQREKEKRVAESEEHTRRAKAFTTSNATDSNDDGSFILEKKRKPHARTGISQMLHRLSFAQSKAPTPALGTNVHQDINADIDSPRRRKFADILVTNIKKLTNLLSKETSSKESNLAVEAGIFEETKTELLKYRYWADRKLMSSYRSFAICRVVQVQVLVEINDIKLDIIKSKLAETESLLEQVRTNEEFVPPAINPPIVSGSTLLSTPEIIKLEAIHKMIEKGKKLQYQSFVRNKKMSKTISPEARLRKLQKIFENTEPDVTGYFEEDYIKQAEFNQFILDQRYLAGRQIAYLLKTLQKGGNLTEPVQAHDIVDFIEQFVKTVQTNFGLPDAYTLNLYICRSIYPLIYFHCMDFASSSELVDAQTASKYDSSVAVLQKIPFSKLPLEFGFLQGVVDQLPIKEAAEVLNGIVYELVPRDMIRVVQVALKLLFEGVLNHTNKPAGADELFPLFLCVLIHCQIPSLEKYIAFLNNFLSPIEKLGEPGYCLVTLEAAFYHVCSLKVDT